MFLLYWDNKDVEQYTTTRLYLLYIDVHNSFLYSDFVMILQIYFSINGLNT